MARCRYCGAETKSSEFGFPVCIDCSRDKPSRDEVAEILRARLVTAQQRRNEASERFDLVIRDVPSGFPRPDGARRIQHASNEYRFALDAVLTAFRSLNEFLLHGTVPEDLDLTKRPGGR
jgi:hypothetical protein